jgi:hypothetical protein
MEKYTLELYPNRGPIYFGLFQNVSNIAQLNERFHNNDETLGLTLIDAKLVREISIQPLSYTCQDLTHPLSTIGYQ